MVGIDGSVGTPAASENRRRLGEPEPMELNRFGVALATTNEVTARGDAAGLASSANAATPATWGVAIEVPLIELVAPSFVLQDDVMLTPGAKTSTHLPKLEKLGLASEPFVAPTVIALGALAGE